MDSMKTKKRYWIVLAIIILLGFYALYTSYQTSNKMTIEELNEKYHLSFDHIREDQIQKEKDSLLSFTYHYKITDTIHTVSFTLIRMFPRYQKMLKYWIRKI